MSTRSDRLAIFVVITLFIGIATAYSIINPPFEATDELRHYRFVRVLVETRQLPVQGQETCRSQSHHPPLFYVLGALATSMIDTGKDICEQPERNPFWAYRFSDVGTDNKNQYFFDQRAPLDWERIAVLIIRSVNVAIGAATVWLTWKIGRILYTKNNGVALTAASIVAFNPMFAFMAGAINNDIIAALSSTLVLYYCVAWFAAEKTQPWRWGIRFGVAFGLALLSKFNNLPLLVLISAELLYVTIRNRQWLYWLKLNITLIASTVAICGWWFLRNQRLYGEPTGIRILTELWGVREPTDSIGLAISELPQVWSSLWGRFGFGQVPLPDTVYIALFAFVVIGLLFAIRYAWTQFRSSGLDALVMLLIPTSFVATFAAVVFYYMLISPAGAMGRFFFPALPALALLIAIGWAQFSRRQTSLSPAIRVGLPMLVLTLFALLGYLRPAYAFPGQKITSANIDKSADVAGLGTILDYDISSDSVEPGGTLTVDLHWKVSDPPIGNFVMFTHLIDEAGFVSQRDSHTGEGRFPTSYWRAGDNFTDSITLQIPETVVAGISAEISIGFYAPNEGYRLQFQSADATPIGDTFVLGNVRVIEPAQRVAQNFDNAIALLDYQISERVVDGNGQFTASLRWETLAEELTNYEVQLLLLDEQENYRGSVDINPSTDKWQKGDINTTIHVFSLDELQVPIEPGIHILRLAVQERKTSIKAMHLAASGTEISDHIDLTSIRVTP